MNYEFLESFNKDLRKLGFENVSDNVLEVVENVENANSPKAIRNLKKLKGFKNAFRDYRIGVFIENDTLEFARIAHRKKFYNIFP